MDDTVWTILYMEKIIYRVFLKKFNPFIKFLVGTHGIEVAATILENYPFKLKYCKTLNKICRHFGGTLP